MKLEEAMRHEIERLESEINSIDAELEKLDVKIQHLTNERKKMAYDLKALTTSFDEDYVDKESQEILERIIRGQKSVKA
jgi:predicted nuclease with TOPRIM domain